MALDVLDGSRNRAGIMILTSLDFIQYGKCSVNNSAGGRPARDIVRLKTGMQFGMDGLDMRRVGAVVMIFNMVFFASLNIIARFQKHAHRKVCTSNRERR